MPHGDLDVISASCSATFNSKKLSEKIDDSDPNPSNKVHSTPRPFENRGNPACSSQEVNNLTSNLAACQIHLDSDSVQSRMTQPQEKESKNSSKKVTFFDVNDIE